MKYSYRITKYTLTDNAGNFTSLADEWTSFYDIGSKVTEDEYKKTESKYIDYILDACNCLSVKSLKIKDLELNVDKSQYSEGEIIQLDEVRKVVQSILREQIWCKLISNDCQFHFGYDFYMYFLFNTSFTKCLEHIKTELTVQEHKSPYQ
ncbi:hypothetical protein LZ633_18855 [Enterobacter asburiae]|nr:hypothetical protein [Enterobacter asburiae]